MKMTPEQKAFFEYGEAVANLSFAKDFLRLNLPSLKKYKDILSSKEEACRAWNPIEGRECPNCKYFNLSVKDNPCLTCYPYEYQKLWEPRKEAGND